MNFALLFTLLASFISYVSLAYGVEKENFRFIFTLSGLLFASYLFWSFKLSMAPRFVFRAGLLFRLAGLLAFPLLSDDIYRYYWDGLLNVHGINPYQFKPVEFIQLNHKAPFEELYPYLNSQEYHSVYPAFMQYLFGLCARFTTNIEEFSTFLRLFVISADIGIFFLLKELMKFIKRERILVLYFLNPLIIIEFSFNLHTEIFLILAVALLLVGLYSSRFILSGFGLAMAVAVKLYPLLFIPFLYQRSAKVNSKLAFAFAIGIALFFLPVIKGESLQNMFESIRLYYQHFEFNASFYYLVRTFGIWWKGYNTIAQSGPILGALSLFLVAILALYRILRNRYRIAETAGFLAIALLAYYSLSTTVMPWYIGPILFLSVLADFRFGLMWSFTVFLSYHAYSPVFEGEFIPIIILEYSLLIVFIVLDFKRLKNKNSIEPDS